MNIYQPFQMETPEDAASHFATGPVSSRPYHDPEWWELEKEAIFKRSWLHIAHMCEIPEPGCFIRKTVEFADSSLVIVHGRDGVVRTFHNVCTHRGTELVLEDQGKRGKFSCIYHNWTFGTDGNLLSAPDFELFHVTKESCALKQVSTEVLAGMVFINFDPEPRQSRPNSRGCNPRGSPSTNASRASRSRRSGPTWRKRGSMSSSSASLSARASSSRSSSCLPSTSPKPSLSRRARSDASSTPSSMIRRRSS
jgi:nitrite reductase/ring-hydroxylating ferredoxin subunit